MTLLTIHALKLRKISKDNFNSIDTCHHVTCCAIKTDKSLSSCNFNYFLCFCWWTKLIMFLFKDNRPLGRHIHHRKLLECTGTQWHGTDGPWCSLHSSIPLKALREFQALKMQINHDDLELFKLCSYLWVMNHNSVFYRCNRSNGVSSLKYVSIMLKSNRVFIFILFFWKSLKMIYS